MKSPSKILWGEGLFLRPQHFQQQDRYHEERLHQIFEVIHPYGWGVRTLQIDKEALVHNILRIIELSAVFQDGDVFSGPENDTLPDDISLSDIPPAQQTVTYHIALPAFKQFGGNFSPSASKDIGARYVQANVDTVDHFTHAASAELTYLKKAAQLLSELEPRSSFVHFPLLRLRRAATGGFEVDPAFVPPSLSIRSAPGLFIQLRRLMDALQAKVNALYGHHREPSKNVIEFRSGDIASFWLLHTASAAFASLNHYFQHPALHPERLYEQLLTIAGGLMTFSKSYTLSDLPAYQHQDPGPCFSTLHSIIRDLLDTVISSRYLSIALNEAKPSYYHGMLDSGKINEQTSFFLAVSADMPAIELVEVAPLRFKAGAPDDVEKFVLSAMPGIRITHSPQVPAAIPVKPDTYYFAIDNKGPLYERMLQAQTISIYVPSGIRDLKLDLYAVTS